MVWATPGNISTTNLDSNEDSPSLARADIKTAFDELKNVANNTKVSFTPAINLTAGSFAISYDSQVGNYIKMGDIIFFELAIQFDTTINDSGAFHANIEVTGLPANPSSTIAPVHIEVQETAASGDLTEIATLRIQASGTKALCHKANGDLETPGNSASNRIIKAKGWYFV